MSVVLDSSMTLSWYFEDECTEASQAVLRQVAAQGAVAPALWRLEVANALVMSIRRKRITTAYCDASLRDLATLTILIDPESERSIWSETIKLADRHALTIYDAVYLELARRRRLPLATLAENLRAAARSVGMVVLG